MLIHEKHEETKKEQHHCSTESDFYVKNATAWKSIVKVRSQEHKDQTARCREVFQVSGVPSLPPLVLLSVDDFSFHALI